LRKEAKKATASATKEGGHRNRKKGGNPQFISNFEVCENHTRKILPSIAAYVRHFRSHRSYINQQHTIRQYTFKPEGRRFESVRAHHDIGGVRDPILATGFHSFPHPLDAEMLGS
jgi:hypothetical protein